MAEDLASPVTAAEPPKANPLGGASTLKLKPVIRKPTLGGTGVKPTLPKPAAAPVAAPAPAASQAPAMDQLKTVTQKLKGITQQIPQQAILRKTGIIADQDLTDAQKQAAKARTARISLSEAIGVAPVKEEAAPMKTIRIKRPVALQSSSNLPAQAAAEEAAPVAEAAPKAPTLTQRKTLKISRPTGGAVRPGGSKFGVKKPTLAPDAGAGEVADIPDLPPQTAVNPFLAAQAQPQGEKDVSKGVAILSLIVQIAACVVIGALGYFLFQDCQLPLHCGGIGLGQ